MDYSKYQNQVPYRTKPTKPSLPKNPTAQEARQYANDIEAYATFMEEVEASRNEYRKEEANILGQFQADALEEVGLANHPKKDIIFSKAWQNGHSGGFSEVFGQLQDLASFVEELEAK